MSIKIAFLGGGSIFTLTFLQGLAYEAQQARGYPGEIFLSLYDIHPERAELWSRYAGVLNQTGLVRVTAEVLTELDPALDSAEVVFLSIGFKEAEQLAEEMREKFHFPRQSIHDGPPAYAYAKKIFPFLRDLGRRLKDRSPQALLVVLPNPTDVLSSAVQRATGVTACGLCVEVEHLRDHLAYYLGCRPEEVELEHAGVNHDGWVTGLWIQGVEGFSLLKGQIPQWPQRPDFHPGNWGMVVIFGATGRLRSSAYHNWPLEVGPYSGPQRWEDFGVPREKVYQAVEEAIRENRILDFGLSQHPENRYVKYLGTGRALVRLLKGRSTGRAERVVLQVENRSTVTNIPTDCRVEVTVKVQSLMLNPLPFGPLPEPPAGITRLLALQRRWHSDYLVTGDFDSLKTSLMTFPVGPISRLIEYAQVVHSL